MENLVNKATIIFVGIIVILGAVFLWGYQPQPAQDQIKYTVGILMENDVYVANTEGFKSKMSELGYVEGNNVEYVIKNLSADAKLRNSYIDELINRKPNLIVMASTPGAQEIRKRNLSIPVVFMDIGSTDGIIDNLSSPEGNITGVLGGSTEFAGKRLEMLKSLVPSITKIIISPDKNYPNYVDFKRSLEAAAKPLGVEIAEIPSKDFNDFLNKLPQIINRKNGDAFMYFPGPNNTPPTKENRKKIINALINVKMPSVNHNMEFGAREGILASYGNYRFEIGRQTAVLADKLLKGFKVKEVPVFLVKDLALDINTKTAKEIGVSIPESILSRANEIYKD